MNRWILDTLCCPKCRGSFTLSEIRGTETEITEGFLICKECSTRYSITDGIADLLPEDGEEKWH